MLSDPSFLTAHALVIDGNATMRKAVVAQLQGLGVKKIQQCKGLSDARALLEQQAFDFVLCADLIDGSELTGQSLLEELRRDTILPHSTVFVMMAGEATYAKVVEAAEAALDCFLLRPFRINALSERLLVARRRKLELGPILAALDAGQAEQALAVCLRRFEADQPFALHCARMAAEIQLRTGRIADALALYQRIDTAHQPPWALLGVARAQFAAGDTAAANQTVTAVLAKHPGMVDAYDVLGRVQLEQGELALAMRTLLSVAEMTPGCVLRMQHCGTLAFYLGDQAVAAKQLERAVQLGLGSRLFDGLTLLLLAFVRHDAGDTRRLAASHGQLQQYRKNFEGSRRLQRFEQVANILRVLLARQLDEARAMMLTMAEELAQEDFDLEASNLLLALWSRQQVRDVSAGQQERLVRGIGMRFCVSKATTEILVASAQRNPTISAILRACHETITEQAGEALALANQGQPQQALRQLLDQGALHRNARLIDLALQLARSHAAQLRSACPAQADTLLAEASALQGRFCGPITHLAGVRRSGRAPGGLLLRGQQLQAAGAAPTAPAGGPVVAHAVAHAVAHLAATTLPHSQSVLATVTS